MTAPDTGSGTGFARAGARWMALTPAMQGALLFLVGTFCFSIMATLIKIVGQRIHVTEILMVRQSVMFAMAVPLIWRGYPATLRTARLDLQALRIGLAFTAMLLGFTALIHLPLADATVLQFSKTFFMTLLGIVVLGEVVGIRRWSAIAVGFVGVILVLMPSGEGIDVYRVMAIGAAVCVASVMVVIRVLSRYDQPVTILAFQAAGVGLLMVPAAMWFWVWPTWTELALLGAIGVISAVGQYCTIWGMKLGEASAIAPLDYARLLWAVVLGWFVFADWPGGNVWIGASLVIGAAAYTLYRTRKAKPV